MGIITLNVFEGVTSCTVTSDWESGLSGKRLGGMCTNHVIKYLLPRSLGCKCMMPCETTQPPRSSPPEIVFHNFAQPCTMLIVGPYVSRTMLLRSLEKQVRMPCGTTIAPQVGSPRHLIFLILRNRAPFRIFRLF